MAARIDARRLTALAIVTGASLMFQVALTRVLATLLAYHFGFLAVSLSLVGIGAGGLLVYLWPTRFTGEHAVVALRRWCFVNAAGLVAASVIIVHLKLDDPYQSGGSPGLDFYLGLTGVCLAAAIPALASGVVVATAIRNAGERIGAVYAADLLGAGAGALLAVPAMNLVDPGRLVVVIGIAVTVAGWLFTAGEQAGAGARNRNRNLVIGGVAALLTVGVLVSSLTQPTTDFFPGKQTQVVGSEWNALSRVIGYDTVTPTARAGQIVYDRAWAPVWHASAGHLPVGEDMGLGPQSIGFSMAKGGRALVIGGGGGRDILNALSAGVRNVDVIELNSAIRKIVDGPLAKTSGRPYSMPGVHTTIGEGRSTLARRSTLYDEIHIGFTDTLSSASAQGFALTENNLYTKEAFKEYFDHLRPNGVLSVSRLTELVGREAIRTTVLALAALEDRGIKDPERYVVVLKARDFLNTDFGTTLVRLRPWTDAELASVRQLAAERHVTVAMAPNGPYADDWATLHQAGSWSTFCNAYPLDVCPPTDDRPYFFNMRRFTSLFSKRNRIHANDPVDTLVVTALILLGLSLLGFGVPVLLQRKTMRRPTWSAFGYFAALGFGFITLEIVLIQRFVLFLGFPTYALSVVLAGLLAATGVGSFVIGRAPALQARLRWLLATAVGLIVVSAFALPPVLSAAIQWPMWARVILTLALLVPLGVVMGTAMPTGLTRLAATRPDSLPYAWAVNGLTSVVGSVLSVVIALYLGFRVTTLVAAACYVAALAFVPRAAEAAA